MTEIPLSTLADELELRSRESEAQIDIWRRQRRPAWEIESRENRLRLLTAAAEFVRSCVPSEAAQETAAGDEPPPPPPMEDDPDDRMFD